MGVNVFCQLNAVTLEEQARHPKITMGAEGPRSDGGNFWTNLAATETCICDRD